jgi:hypothetical protein
VFDPAEVAEVKADIHDMLDRLPTGPDSLVDRDGRPAVSADRTAPTIIWSKPLGDPFGGTDMVGGRAPVKMMEPEAAQTLKRQVPLVLTGLLQYSDAALRAYGHPGMLGIAASINGDDFVPYSETLIIKKPHEGGSFAWHQDGTTHWDSPAWDQGIHGVNFMVQLYKCTAANTLWYIPGTHATGRADIKKLVADAGSNRLPGAVPALCNPGDVAISNRQILHASFPNTSDDWRLTMVYSLHRRNAVLGTQTKTAFHGVVTYDDERVCKRSEMIGYAIDARRQRFPDEKPLIYRPHAEAGERYVWDTAARDKIKNYHLRDLYL